jgi:Fe2+ or Zn2+ uptake regulation protein
MSYYNTTQETGSSLAESHAKAKTQEQKIILCFHNQGTPLSASVICELLNDAYPITSIRRALTDMTNQGDLEKTEKKVMGRYGKKEHQWRLRTDKNNQFSLF